MSVFLTAKFKVHNPSKRKQAALDTALELALKGVVLEDLAVRVEDSGSSSATLNLA